MSTSPLIPAPDEAALVLAPGSAFEGVLSLPGPARIEGSLRGRVVGPGSLWIGARGEVEADLDLETVVIAGRLRGQVRARARIELLETASVEGELTAPLLRVADGCRWNGHSRAGRRD